MYILSINGSPRGRDSNTDRMLQPFLAGARDAGATTDVIYVVDLDIRDCRGCFTCWTKTPGRCILHDDMKGVLEQIKKADILVLATPLYHFGMTAHLKRLLERTLPLADPHIIKKGDHFSHPRREEHRMDMVLIANCGFPDRVHFKALEEHMRQLTKDQPDSLLASILCAGGEMLRFGGDGFKWYYDALRRAGREIVEMGHLSSETESILAKELVPLESFLNMANAFWDSQIAPEGVQGNKSDFTSEKHFTGDSRKNEAGEKQLEQISKPNMLPRDCREAVMGMVMAFNPRAAGDMKAVLQINLTGEGDGEFYMVIQEGRCSVHEGKAENATTVITSPADVWLSIARGELDGAGALMQGLYKVTGDFGIMLRMKDLFSGTDSKDEAPARPAGPLPIPGMMWLTVAFLPWIFNWIATGMELNPAVKWGVPALGSLLIWGYRKYHNSPTWMDSISAVYFLVAGVFALAGYPLSPAAGDFSGNLVLGATWLASLAKEVPLTAEYSRWNYPASLADSPMFLRTNAIITAVWGEAYLFMALVILMMNLIPEYKILWMVLRYLPLLQVGVFTAWFPDWYPAYIAAGGNKHR
ncbi:MAG: hypothetical protein PWQ68_1436 [Thermoanaerobacteraceae bacterium]|nr:hypothetical protein [Thermoanaerobacteraceae bacterium]